MNKTVSRPIIDAWVSRNSPDGVAKLALKSRVSISTIAKIRLGYVPKKEGTRCLLARALNVAEAELFPLARDEAS
jgi:transcriptional regulator with XRE-family HTH domain